MELGKMYHLHKQVLVAPTGTHYGRSVDVSRDGKFVIVGEP